MHSYIKHLQAYAAEAYAREEREREERAQVANAAARERLTPIEDRVSRLLLKIPVDVQREGLSLPTIQKSLRGRWRGSCHPGELGAALRKLGFERRRRWDGNAGFGALWYPPP